MQSPVLLGDFADVGPHPSGRSPVEARKRTHRYSAELVRAGLTVQRILDVIPEPDPDIYRALVSLSESGAIGF